MPEETISEPYESLVPRAYSVGKSAHTGRYVFTPIEEEDDDKSPGVIRDDMCQEDD